MRATVIIVSLVLPFQCAFAQAEGVSNKHTDPVAELMSRYASYGDRYKKPSAYRDPLHQSPAELLETYQVIRASEGNDSSELPIVSRDPVLGVAGRPWISSYGDEISEQPYNTRSSGTREYLETADDSWEAIGHKAWHADDVECLIEDSVSEEDEGTYLGQWGGNEFSSDSTRNPFGAGNPYDPDSIANPFGTYGSRFSPYSARNTYATEAPRLYDGDGNYRGKLSNNPYDPDSISNPYGRYGSQFSPESINNPFGAGNQFKSDSPLNPFGNGWSMYGEE